VQLDSKLLRNPHYAYTEPLYEIQKIFFLMYDEDRLSRMKRIEILGINAMLKILTFKNNNLSTITL